MSDDEIVVILEKGFQLLNVEFPKSISNDIVLYSNGLASVDHQLCLNMCNYEGVQETQNHSLHLTKNSLQNAVAHYLEDESDTIKDIFDRALRRRRHKGKFDNCRIISRALVKSEHKEGVTSGELMQIIRNSEPNYPAGNLSLYLNELTDDDRGSILRYDAASGRYLFSNPFHKAFALALFEQEKQKI